MVEQTLIDYIRQHSNQFTPQQIRDSLIQAGWNTHSIDEAFRVLGPPQPATPPAPLPAYGTPHANAPLQGGTNPNEKPNLVLKPRIIAAIFPRFFITLIALIFLFSFLTPLAVFGVLLGIDVFTTIGIVFFVILFLAMLFSYMNLRAREYRFFGDRAEFYEGFLNIRRKVVRYDRITDITYNKSVWERIWGTGSVLLNTAGSPLREVRVSYVRNSEKVYQDVQNLVKGAGSGRTGTEAYQR